MIFCYSYSAVKNKLHNIYSNKNPHLTIFENIFNLAEHLSCFKSYFFCQRFYNYIKISLEFQAAEAVALPKIVSFLKSINSVTLNEIRLTNS